MTKADEDGKTPDYHTINDTPNKAIIIELSESSGDEEIAAVIRCYKIGSPIKEIRKQLKQQYVQPLIKAATFLGLPVNEESKPLKETLITFIIRRIESLLKDLCGVCGEYFNNTLTEEPPFKCLICSQGCHAPCFQEMAIVFQDMPETIKKSFQFICTKCYEDHSDDNTAASEPKKSPVKASEKDVGKEETIEGLIVQPPEPKEPPPQPKHPKDNTEIEVCPAYKWGRCPDYEVCEFRHPPRCWNWLNEGKCSYKKKCKYHHPPLCRDSLRQKQCFNPECKYFHLSKTQRYKREDEQLKTALTPSAYAQQPQHTSQPENRQNNPKSEVHLQARPPPLHVRSTSHPENQHNNQPREIQHPPPCQPPSQPQNSNRVNPSEMSFLVQAVKDIKDVLSREILGVLNKELAEMRQGLKLPAISRVQETTSPSIPRSIPSQFMMPMIIPQPTAIQTS